MIKSERSECEGSFECVYYSKSMFTVGEICISFVEMLSGKVKQVEALNECRFICLFILSLDIIPHHDSSKVGRARFSTKSKQRWKSISLSVLMFLLCAAFFTLSGAICDPAGAMLAQMLHPQGAIVALETSTGSHLGWLSKAPPALTALVCVFISVWDERLCGDQCGHPVKHVVSTRPDIHLHSVAHPVTLQGLEN